MKKLILFLSCAFFQASILFASHFKSAGTPQPSPSPAQESEALGIATGLIVFAFLLFSIVFSIITLVWTFKQEKTA